jgi:hypothetical protein
LHPANRRCRPTHSGSLAYTFQTRTAQN